MPFCWYFFWDSAWNFSAMFRRCRRRKTGMRPMPLRLGMSASPALRKRTRDYALPERKAFFIFRCGAGTSEISVIPMSMTAC